MTQVFHFETTLDAALAYCALGWQVLPIARGQKRPAISNWPAMATDDPAVVRAWWDDPAITRGLGAPNVGILCGIRSKLVVIDVDPRNGGNENLDEYLQELQTREGSKLAILPRLRVQTGSGGLHLYCAYPTTTEYLRSRTGKDTGPRPGIELKADGGQMVVAPPSIHPSGNLYTWLPIEE